MSTLVLLELQDSRIRTPSLAAVTLARELRRVNGAEYNLLLIGSGLEQAAASVSHLGARAVLLVDHHDMAEPLAGRYASAIAAVAKQRGVDTVAAASSTFSKDVLPRAAALLDAGMLTDVVSVESEGGALRFRRPVYAGNALATVELEGTPRVLTCRPTAFAAPGTTDTDSPVEHIAVDPAWLDDGMDFVSREERKSGRPDLAEARVVVSGGRPLKDPETFVRVLGELADPLGAALGATRGAVDSGIAPNDWQVGQTGKVVAPELYIACGVSGAIQHLAGMKDSKVIVAINKDPEAPIFEAATYGLVADLYDAVPALARAVRAARRSSDA